VSKQLVFERKPRRFCFLSQAEFPLLSAFQQIEPYPASAFDHVLYLYHRDALLAPSMTVRDLLYT